jgi:diguanylate cyclase (GGDEF)-like protein
MLALIIALLFTSGNSLAGQEVKVGVYRNLPMVTCDDRGSVGGLQMELLQEIARREGWQLRFVPGSFVECYERLKRHEIDMMPAIAYTPERARFVDFNEETVVVNWGQVVVPHGSRIQSILDLHGKRVAAVRESVYYTGPAGLRTLAAQFGISPQFVEVAEYPDVLRMVAEQKVDAGIVHRFSIGADENRLDVRPSPVVVSPVEVRYAFAKGDNGALSRAVDHHLHPMKEDPSSLYHRLLIRWVGDATPSPLPRWLKPLAVVVGVITTCLLVAFLVARLQVRRSRSDLKERDERLSFVATHDTLTGLPNKHLLQELMGHALAASHRSSSSLALLILDLDRFKNINDTLGHSWGDRILKDLAERLRGMVREIDTVARYGGDEFALLLEDLPDDTAAALVARKILEEVARPFVLEGREFSFSASIGISIHPSERPEREDLFTSAEIAMYVAKEEGGNAYRFYQPEMDARVHERLSLESELRLAMEKGQLTVHYQPLCNMTDGSVRGLEALVRWNHPERGMVPPGDFIPIAEGTGLMVPLGEWILRQVCRQLQEWRQRGINTVPVSVNISARQFRHPDFITTLDRALEDFSIPASMLELEITESITMGDFDEVLTTLTQIRQRGIALAMDDFGTGYSSLCYLKRFPIDTLKIDRSFVRDITMDPNDAAIADAIIAMAESMGLGVIAEGIETAEQLQLLLDKGCLLGQGFYFSRPVPPEEAELLLTTPA